MGWLVGPHSLELPGGGSQESALSLQFSVKVSSNMECVFGGAFHVSLFLRTGLFVCRKIPDPASEPLTRGWRDDTVMRKYWYVVFEGEIDGTLAHKEVGRHAA